MRKSKYTIEVLLPLVLNNKSYAGVIKDLGLKLTGGNYRYIQKRIKSLDIDTSHFTGARWNVGESASTHPSLKKLSENTRYKRQEVFTPNSPVSNKVVRSLYELEPVEYRCAIPACGIASWLGSPITLHLDHIDGNSSNNVLSNLRWLCPNCHQQTDTWGNKKKKAA